MNPSLLALVTLLAAGAESWFTGSEAYRDLRRSGREVAAEKMLDCDGDGLAEALVAERSAEGVGLSVWRGGEKQVFTLLGRLPPSPGELVRFDVLRLDEHTPALWWEVAEENPDEDDHQFRLVLLEPAPRVVLSTDFRVQHAEQVAGRPARRVVWLGPDFQGVRTQAAAGGWPSFQVWRHPRLVALRGEREPVFLVLGLEELVFVPEGRSYRLEREGYLNFLPLLEGVTTEKTVATSGSDGGGATTPAAVISLRLPQAAPVRMLRLFFGCPRQQAAALSALVLQLGKEAPLTLQPGAASADARVTGTGEFIQADAQGWQQLMLLEQAVTTDRVRLELFWSSSAGPPCLPEVTLHRELAVKTE